MTVGSLVRVLVLGSTLHGGCREIARISPERSPLGDAGALLPPSPSERPKADKTLSTQPKPQAASQVGGRFARATPNTGSGSIELVLADHPIPCGAYQPFPKTCEPAWRIRIELEPTHQQVGEYLLGEELSPFSYKDAQGKSSGVWEPGVDCKNLGSHFDAVLEITSIEASAITGTLTGAGDADGSFRAERCPSCKGVRMSCTSNAECCNDLCWNGRCQP